MSIAPMASNRSVPCANFPFKADGTTYRAGEMDSLLGSGESAVVQIAHHVTCVSGGKLTDVWDCRGKSVYGYWVLRKGNGSRR